MATVDTNTLLEWAQSHTSGGRNALAEAMTNLFAGGSDGLSDRERALMADILQKVVVDLELTVRQSMSEKLADLPDAPADLIRFLANDEASVAAPLLARSGVLQDDDLLEIIRHRTLEHQMAITMRFSVSETVSGALADTGNVNVIESLLRNENARLSQATLAYLVDESKRLDSFREPLLRREELGPKLAKRMFLWVSAALRNQIINRFELDEATVDALLEEAALESIEESAADDAPSGADRLAKELDQEMLLDIDTLVRALAMGEVNLFIAMFARAAGLRDRLVRRMLFASRCDDFAIACKAVDIDRDTFATLVSLSDSARPQAAEEAPAASRDPLAAYDRISGQDARRILRRWRLDPEFIAAIEELETAAAVHG
jgi:uncharacterized protein (DUF2336 family)